MKRVALVTAISWLGFVAHNVADLPRSAWFGPETLLPTAIYALLLLAWRWPGPRWARPALLFWGWLHAIGGGILSVLPLAILPFQPAQTPYHYVFHLVYLITQLPLLVTLHKSVAGTRDPGVAS